MNYDIFDNRFDSFFEGQILGIIDHGGWNDDCRNGAALSGDDEVKGDLFFSIMVAIVALTPPYDASSVAFGMASGIFFQCFWLQYLGVWSGE